MDIYQDHLSGVRSPQMFASLLILLLLAVFSLFDTYSPLLASVDLQSEVIPQPMTLDEMSEQFAEVRNQKGHFDGQTWNNEVDLWSGRKHVLMESLSRHLDSSEADKEMVLQVMGMPDDIVNKSSEGFDELASEEHSGEILIYYWRNKHDYLYFSCAEEKRCNANWWYAFE